MATKKLSARITTARKATARQARRTAGYGMVAAVLTTAVSDHSAIARDFITGPVLTPLVGMGADALAALTGGTADRLVQVWSLLPL